MSPSTPTLLLRKEEMNDLPCPGTHTCLFPESRALTSDLTPCRQGWVPACTPPWADTMPACLRAQLTSRHPEAVGPGRELLHLPALGGGCVHVAGVTQQPLFPHIWEVGPFSPGCRFGSVSHLGVPWQPASHQRVAGPWTSLPSPVTGLGLLLSPLPLP